ncbi:MAG: L,D-transpeptidase [Magnetococcales bacterium]|nr:L,D-transpeptidase [Magnetococcales bacterium]
MTDPVAAWLPAANAALRSGGWNGVEAAVVVDGAAQRLYLLPACFAPPPAGEPVAQTWNWPISTAAAGFGNRQDSGQTPVGLHRIAACIGEGAPCGMIFKSRVATGEVVADDPQQAGDFITTRILWLDGLEEGVNRGEGCDSRARYIYIHGTPHASRLGQPASAGCIRMDNRHILELFAQVQTGTLVWIRPDPSLPLQGAALLESAGG